MLGRIVKTPYIMRYLHPLVSMTDPDAKHCKRPAWDQRGSLE